MKYAALNILFVFIFHMCFAQSNLVADSLRAELDKAKNDTDKVAVLSELSFQYRLTNPDSALKFGWQGLELARKLHREKEEASVLSNIAFAMRDLGNLPGAMDLQFKALNIAERNGYDNEAGLSMIRLSAIYTDLADYPKALHYLQQAFLKFKQADFERGTAIVYMNLGQVYLEMNRLDSALYYEKKAYPMMLKLHVSGLIAYTLYLTGNIYQKMGNGEMALEYFRKSSLVALDIQTTVYGTISLTQLGIAQIYLDKKNEDSCIYYAKQSLANAQYISNRNGIIEAANLLSKVYEKSNITQSYAYFKMAAAEKDSLLNKNTFNALQSLTFEKEERERNIDNEKKAFQNRTRLNALIAGLLLFLVVAIILYRNNQQKQKANKVLQTTLSDLKATQTQLIQSEKMASLGELTAGIAHEIQNPLNFVNNFSEVNKELLLEMKDEIDKGNINEVKSIANDLIDNQEKINHHGKRADSIVKGMMQHSQVSSGQKEPTDINALAGEYLRLSYHGLRAKDKSFNADIKTDFDETTGKINIVPQDIGRVLLNLYNNAFYAVTEKGKQSANGYQPTVKVSTRKLNDTIEIRVDDNGNGIPQKIIDKIFQPFFTTKPTGQGTGLGLSLSYDIIKAHGGEIKVDTKEGEGTVFIIQLRTT